MPNLSISIPTLQYETLIPGSAVFEKPLEVRCQGAHFPDGAVFDPSQLGSAGLFFYREVSLGAALEIWDEDGRQWLPDPGLNVTSLKALPLAFMESTWKGIVVAAGQKHPNQFQKAVGAFPQYLFRAWFSGRYRGAGIAGLSAASSALRFVGVLDTLRAGVTVDPGQSPATASELQIFLRNPALQLIGLVHLRTSGGAAEIEISNWSSGTLVSSMKLLASGEIQLKPAAGQKVLIEGPLEAGEITYQPIGGGPKITLPKVP